MNFRSIPLFVYEIQPTLCFGAFLGLGGHFELEHRQNLINPALVENHKPVFIWLSSVKPNTRYLNYNAHNETHIQTNDTITIPLLQRTPAIANMLGGLTTLPTNTTLHTFIGRGVKVKTSLLIYFQYHNVRFYVHSVPNTTTKQ